jgi:hypothetical protein
MVEFIKSYYSHNICVWCPFMITIWTCIYDFGQYILTLFVNCMNIVACNYGARGVQLWIINHPTLAHYYKTHPHPLAFYQRYAKAKTNDTW